VQLNQRALLFFSDFPLQRGSEINRVLFHNSLCLFICVLIFIIFVVLFLMIWRKDNRVISIMQEKNRDFSVLKKKF
jgi:hypothetical protein